MLPVLGGDGEQGHQADHADPAGQAGRQQAQQDRPGVCPGGPEKDREDAAEHRRALLSDSAPAEFAVRDAWRGQYYDFHVAPARRGPGPQFRWFAHPARARGVGVGR